MQQDPRLAEEPLPPKATPVVQKLRQERLSYLRQREALESRSIWRGLLWLAIVVLCFAAARAGMGRAFYPGWWRQW